MSIGSNPFESGGPPTVDDAIVLVHVGHDMDISKPGLLQQFRNRITLGRVDFEGDPGVWCQYLWSLRNDASNQVKSVTS
jgi:hypothetical protein